MNQGDKARAQLYELQKQGENKLCMDCGSRGTLIVILIMRDYSLIN